MTYCVLRDDFVADIWSSGCVMAELLLGQPIFPGDSGVDQLVEIIKVLGTPSKDQIKDMNPNYNDFKFPQIKAHPWERVSKDFSSPKFMVKNFHVNVRDISGKFWAALIVRFVNDVCMRDGEYNFRQRILLVFLRLCAKF